MALAEHGQALKARINTEAKDIEISEVQTNGNDRAQDSAALKIFTAFTSINDAEAEMRAIEQIPETARDDAIKIRYTELLAASQRLVTAVVFSHRRQPARFTLSIEQPTDQTENPKMPILVIKYPHPTRRDVIYSARAPLSRFAKGRSAVNGIVDAVTNGNIIPQALIRPPSQPFR